MTDIAVLLDAVSANITGLTFDAGDLKDELTMVVSITGTVSAYSVQLEGSLDGTAWENAGVPDTSAGAAGADIGPVAQSTAAVAVSKGHLYRYFRAVLASYSGTGTVTATLAFGGPG